MEDDDLTTQIEARANDLVKLRVDDALRAERAAQKERADKLRLLGRALRLQDRVDSWIDERENGELVAFETISQRELGAAADREAKDSKINAGVRAEAGGYDERDIRALSMASYLLVHRGGFSPQQVRVALESNRTGGRRFIDKNLDLREFDFAQQGARYMGHPLMALARRSLHEEGRNTDGLGIEDVAVGALRGGRGANTTSAFPLALAETLNTSVRIGYAEFPATYEGWAQRSTVPDFRVKYNLTMGNTEDLEKVNEKGEYETSVIAENREGYRVYKYGRIFGLTFEVIVNDRLDAITQIPRKFGQSAVRRQRAIVYGILTNNAAIAEDSLALFHSSRNIESSAAIPSIGAIDSIGQAFENRPGLTPGTEAPHVLAHILTGSSWFVHTQQVLGIVSAPTAARADGSGIAQQVPLSYAGLMVHRDPLLNSYDAGGGAGNAWYGLAATDTIEYAFLEGESGVMTSMMEHFDSDMLKIKARLIFGAGPKDWRGMQLNPGAAS